MQAYLKHLIAVIKTSMNELFDVVIKEEKNWERKKIWNLIA